MEKNIIATTFNKYPKQCSVRIEDAWEMSEGNLYLKMKTEVDIYRQNDEISSEQLKQM